jgi:hypothetical protein
MATVVRNRKGGGNINFFKESLINSNSIHLGPRTGLSDKILKGDHQRIILAKLESNWPSSLRGKKSKFHPQMKKIPMAI